MAQHVYNVDIPLPETPREQFFENAFPRFVAMGDSRNYQSLSRELRVDKRELMAHAKRFNWPHQIARVMAKAREKTEEMMAEGIAEVNCRHIEDMKQFQQLALKQLQVLIIDKPADAIKLYFAAFDGERRARGLDKEKSNQTEQDVLLERIKEIGPAPAGSEFQLPPPEKK